MTWSLVQKSASENRSTTGTTTPTLPGASTAGNLLVACLMSSNGSSVFTGPAGWVQGPAVQNGASDRAEIWYYPNNPGGISSAAFTSGTSTVLGNLAEFSTDVVNPVVTLEASGTGTAGAVTTCTATASGANSAGDLSICSFGWKSTTAATLTFTDPTNFTGIADDHATSANTHGYGAYQLNTASGTLAPTLTASTAPVTWTGVVAAFLASPGVAQPTPAVMRPPGRQSPAAWAPLQVSRVSPNPPPPPAPPQPTVTPVLVPPGRQSPGAWEKLRPRWQSPLPPGNSVPIPVALLLLSSPPVTVLTPPPGIPIFPAGAPWQPSDFNAAYQAPLLFLRNRIVLRARQTISQNVGASVYTPLAFDTIDEDPYDLWSTTATASQAANSWQPLYDGLYRITVTVHCQGITMGLLQAAAGISGAQNLVGAGVPVNSNNTGGCSASVTQALTGGQDYVQGMAFGSLAFSTQNTPLGLQSSMEIMYLSS